MQRQPASFEKTYGSVTQQLELEYQLFLTDVCSGYRADLCAWDWKTKFTLLKSGMTMTKRVEARRGWQATGVSVVAGTEYRFETADQWSVVPGNSTDANGQLDGRGRLVGAILKDGRLGAEIELGSMGKFTAGANGDWFVRCRDDWGAIANNEGAITLKVLSAP